MRPGAGFAVRMGFSLLGHWHQDQAANRLRGDVPPPEALHQTVLDYLRDDWVEQARAFAGPDGFDVILDGNGGPNAARNLELIGVLGRLVYIGATAGAPAPAVPTPVLIARCFSVGGVDLRSAETKLGRVADAVINEAFLAGRWRAPLSEVVPLSAVADLHRRLEARELMGRVVIEVGGAQPRRA